MDSDPLLTWGAVDWKDPDGGILRFLPYCPLVNHADNVEWDGLALIASSEDLALWSDQDKEEADSPGIVRDAMIANLGPSGRVVKEMVTLDDSDVACFPDPVPFNLLQKARSEKRRIWCIEPNLDDSKWVDMTLLIADSRTRVRSLLRAIGATRRVMKMAKIIAMEPPSINRTSFHIAASLQAAWWRNEMESVPLSLLDAIHERLAARLRGALSQLRTDLDGQVDDGGEKVMLVPVPQVRLPEVLEALGDLPEPEDFTMEEE